MGIASAKPIILTVDDDPVILNLVLAALQDEYAVRPFTSGPAVLTYLENNDADLILLDHNMPEMTGFQVLEILQADTRLSQIPIIFLTGSASSDTEVIALENGAVDYLLKPFKPGALITRVRLQLELSRYRHSLEDLVEQKTFELTELNMRLIERDKATLDILAQTSDLRDHDTGAHLDRTTAYTKIIVDDLLAFPTEGYTVTQEHGQDIVDAVKLHDLGKLAMPDFVLLKPGSLTEEEFAIIKTHPIHGYNILKGAIDKMSQDTLLNTAIKIVHSHHEKWDGTGYPEGMQGTEIPLCARIATIADVFDALTSIRPYKQAIAPKEALEIMYSDSGIYFDPYLIEVVKRHEAEFTTVAITLSDSHKKTLFEDIYSTALQS